MHEFSLIADLLRKIEAVARESGGKRVLAAKVKLGALSHISADHFRGHFNDAVRGSALDGIHLDVETLTDMSDPHAQEIILDSVEVEEDE